jgi:CO/xanthine dehydrogenase FAD-binding subunit
MKNFQYFSPKTLNEVIALLESFGENAFVMAGGTDLLVRMKNGEKNPACLIDLKGIPKLEHIDYGDNEGVKIGALSSIADIEKHPCLIKYYSALAEAASSIGSAQIRNKGTIGGNLCNASPSADMAPPLIVMDAVFRTFGKAGERVIRSEDFFMGPGKTILQSCEVLTEIQVPRPPVKSGAAYLKFSRRGGLDLAIVGVACLLAVSRGSCCERARISMGAVAPTPLRAKKAETLMTGEKISDELIEEAAEVASQEAKPISDIRASANYRIEIIKTLVRRAIRISMRRLELMERINET